jgi:hypothetical protein
VAGAVEELAVVAVGVAVPELDEAALDEPVLELEPELEPELEFEFEPLPPWWLPLSGSTYC